MKSYYYNSDIFEAGVDEAGRGTLIGPVFASAVILPPDIDFTVKDSKKLSKRQRTILRDEIEENSIDYAISYIDNNEIDKINILNSSIKAMHQALEQLSIIPELIIVDGNRFKPFHNIPHHCIIKGDSLYNSIASASILAKVYHDEYMEKLCDKYNVLDEYYDIKNNMGYGTQKHRDGIDKYGITEFHRKTYKSSFNKEFLDLNLYLDNN